VQLQGAGHATARAAAQTLHVKHYYTSHIICQTSRHVTHHDTSPITTRHPSRHVKQYDTSNITTRQTLRHVKHHHTSNITTRQTSPHVKHHDTSNITQRRLSEHSSQCRETHGIVQLHIKTAAVHANYQAKSLLFGFHGSYLTLRHDVRTTITQESHDNNTRISRQ
jgi:hypothetical protein